MGMGIIFILFTTMIKAQSNGENLQNISIEDAQEQALKRMPLLKAKQLELEQQEVLKKTARNFGNTVIYTGKDEAGKGADRIYTRIGIQQEEIGRAHV